MALTNLDPIVVDDADPQIQYSSGWQALSTGGVVDGTKHGAAAAGLTATFTFTGTEVAVVGPLGSIDVHGMPTTTYSIDGTIVGTYTAPIVKPGTFVPNVTYFVSSELSAGSHTLEITNMNGTAPNVYWLDYIQYLPVDSSVGAQPTKQSSSSSSAKSTSAPATSSSSSSPADTSPPASQATSDASSSATQTTPGASSSATGSSVLSGLSTLSNTDTQTQSSAAATSAQSATLSPTANHDSSASASSTSSNVGPIVGGVVGGVAVLLLAALLFFYIWRRRARWDLERAMQAYTAEPKPESPDSSHGPARSSKRPLLSTSTPSSAAASFVLPLSPSTSAAAGFHSSASRPQSPASHAWAPQPATAPSVYPPSEADAGGDAEVEAAAAQERAVDSGLRIASIGQLPPAYTRD